MPPLENSAAWWLVGVLCDVTGLLPSNAGPGVLEHNHGSFPASLWGLLPTLQSAMRPPCHCFSRRYHWGIALPYHDVTRSHYPVTMRPPHFLPPLGSPSVSHLPLGRMSPPPPLYAQWVPPSRDFLPLETVLEEGGGTRPCTPEGESPKRLHPVVRALHFRSLHCWLKGFYSCACSLLSKSHGAL